MISLTVREIRITGIEYVEQIHARVVRSSQALVELSASAERRICRSLEVLFLKKNYKIFEEKIKICETVDFAWPDPSKGFILLILCDSSTKLLAFLKIEVEILY